MDPPETRYAKSGDLHIAYQVTGSGPLDLIVCPAPSPIWSLPGKIRPSSASINGLPTSRG
jgi:hypothetical protein